MWSALLPITVFIWALLTLMLLRMPLRMPISCGNANRCPAGLQPSSWTTMQAYREALLREGFVSSGPLITVFQLDPSEAMAVNLLLESFEHRGRGHRASTMAVFDHPNAQTLRPTLAFTMRLPDSTRLEVLNAPVWLLTTHVLIEHPYQFSNEEDASRLYTYFRAIVSKLSPGAKSPPIENGDWVGDLRRQFGETYDDATRRGCITPTGTRGEYRLSVLFAAKFSWTLLPTVSRVLSWRTMLRNRRLLRELRAAGLLTD